MNIRIEHLYHIAPSPITKTVSLSNAVPSWRYIQAIRQPRLNRNKNHEKEEKNISKMLDTNYMRHVMQKKKSIVTRKKRTQPRYLVLPGSFDSCITEKETLLSKYYAIHLCPQAGQR